MGIQGRDYYRARYRAPYFSSTSGKRSTGIKYILSPILVLAVFWWGSYALLDRIKNGKLSGPECVPYSNYNLLDFPPGGIVLKTDQQGHFRGTALVNNVPMPFLIDTGATKIVLPIKMAIAAGLPFGRAIQINTAGGKVYERETKINSLKIGNAEIRNLDAQINEHLDEVLIGMNTLKYFHITQNGNTLTLVVNNQKVHHITNAQTAAFNTAPIQQPINKPVIVKKTLTCDEHNVCKTTYSDR